MTRSSCTRRPTFAGFSDGKGRGWRFALFRENGWAGSKFHFAVADPFTSCYCRNGCEKHKVSTFFSVELDILEQILWPYISTCSSVSSKYEICLFSPRCRRIMFGISISPAYFQFFLFQVAPSS